MYGKNRDTAPFCSRVKLLVEGAREEKIAAEGASVLARSENGVGWQVSGTFVLQEAQGALI